MVTGGILPNSIDTIGVNNVTVPSAYYKIALHAGTDTTAIGFIIPNEASNNDLENFVVSIDSIEAVTNINFFYHIRNQDKFEKEVGNWIVRMRYDD